MQIRAIGLFIHVGQYLTLFGRWKDISSNYPNKKVRAALVTSKGWQSGVKQLNEFYGKKLSLFHVTEIGEVADKIHTAFIYGSTKSTINENKTPKKVFNQLTGTKKPKKPIRDTGETLNNFSF